MLVDLNRNDTMIPLLFGYLLTCFHQRSLSIRVGIESQVFVNAFDNVFCFFNIFFFI